MPNQQSPSSNNSAWGAQSPWRQQPPQPPTLSKHSNYNAPWGNNGSPQDIANNNGYNVNGKDRGTSPLRGDPNRPMMNMDNGNNPHQPPSVYCLPTGTDMNGKHANMTMNMMMMDGIRSKKISNNIHRDDKGRGSYRCGKCGVPKKGHVCPYQPKLKRRSDEPPPDLKNASTQVELDEFLVMRRLNLEIQGYPESYATVPDNVGAEVAPSSPDKSIDASPSQTQMSSSSAMRSNTLQGPLSSSNGNTPDNLDREDAIGVTPPR